jgi:hypothetical protein
MASKKSWRQRISGWLGGTNIAEAPGSGGSNRDPSETVVKRIGLALDVGTSREFQAPEFDLTQITNAYDTEAYVRQAVDKYIEMMFKAGWDFVGKNQAAVDYIRLRFKLMAEMTQTPTDQLLIEIAEDLVKYSNVIIAKARDKQNLLGSSNTGITVQGMGGEAPVVGYYPLNVTTMSILRDKNGTVQRWQQEVDGQDKPVAYKKQDIVHMYYKKEKGKAFATPFLLSALDDIRSLRQAEETVLRLIYRNLHPLLHIKVGSDELPGQQAEVDVVRDEFENMDLEAGFVTSERVAINSVSADKIIDAKEYLKYFEQRVFTGLGVSELMMGRGNTANRSTGDNLSGEFLDRVKAFQKVMAIFIDEFMVKELLMEGGFDPVLNPDDDVDFVFKEIDVDAKIKAENHAIFQYEHNTITEDEMRAMLGRDPITDRAQMFMNLVTIPVGAANKADTGDAGTAATNNKNKPTNQNGTKSAPKKKTESNDSEFKLKYLESMDKTFEHSHSAVTKLIDQYLENNDEQRLEELSQIVRLTEEDLVQVMQHHLGMDYTKSYVIHLHKLCERLHHEILETVTEMKGAQKDARIYETLGGIYDVFTMRLSDIASKAHETYISINPLDTPNKEVE